MCVCVCVFDGVYVVCVSLWCVGIMCVVFV